MKRILPFALLVLSGCPGPSAEPVGSGGVDGGSTGTGGASAGSGGVGGTGGTTASGGSSSGGASGTGGAGSGGLVGSGGRAGAPGSGGATSSGGTTGSGGSTAALCTSGETWTAADFGDGPDMRPGLDCQACHRTTRPSFTISGTIYPTAHEPDNCLGGVPRGITVVITGADGVAMTLFANETSGNFYSTAAVKTPFTAKVVNSAGATRAMAASQTTGDCNTCHTQTGNKDAPGRIMLP